MKAAEPSGFRVIFSVIFKLLCCPKQVLNAVVGLYSYHMGYMESEYALQGTVVNLLDRSFALLEMLMLPSERNHLIQSLMHDMVYTIDLSENVNGAEP